MNTVGVMMRAIDTTTGGTRTEAKLQALQWLSRQLEWERTLEVLRGEEDDAARKAA
jgi:hypothetical protein